MADGYCTGQCILDTPLTFCLLLETPKTRTVRDLILSLKGKAGSHTGGGAGVVSLIQRRFAEGLCMANQDEGIHWARQRVRMRTQGCLLFPPLTTVLRK